MATSRWMKVRMDTGMTIAVDSMKAYSGTKALHITATNLKGGICDTCGSIVMSTKPGDAAFGAAGTKPVIVRFMMFLKTFTQSGDNPCAWCASALIRLPRSRSPPGYAFDLHFDKPAPFQFERFNDMYIKMRKWIRCRWRVRGSAGSIR